MSPLQIIPIRLLMQFRRLIRNDHLILIVLAVIIGTASAFDHDVDDLINAGDVAREHPPLLEPGDDLETANRVIRESGEHYIPVVENHSSMKLLGTLHEMDLMAAYNRALLEARREEHDGTL